MIKVVPKLNYLIKKAYKNWNDRTKKQLLSKFKLNLKTNRYNYEGNISNEDLEGLVSEDKDGFSVNFGEITGNFDCSGLDLRSLKGAPQTVRGDFDCSWNNLISLKESPREVGGNFSCYKNLLTSLEGSPQKIVDGFYCFNNQLTSLEGAPQTVGGNFDCRKNPNLKSLKGIGSVRGTVKSDL